MNIGNVIKSHPKLSRFIAIAFIIVGILQIIGSFPTSTVYHVVRNGGEYVESNNVYITRVSADSPADLSGLLAGDRIISLNSNDITSIEDVQDSVRDHAGELIDIDYERNGEVSSVNLLSRENPPVGEGAIGVSLNNYELGPRSLWVVVPEAIVGSYLELWGWGGEFVLQDLEDSLFNDAEYSPSRYVRLKALLVGILLLSGGVLIRRKLKQAGSVSP